MKGLFLVPFSFSLKQCTHGSIAHACSFKLVCIFMVLLCMSLHKERGRSQLNRDKLIFSELFEVATSSASGRLGAVSHVGA